MFFNSILICCYIQFLKRHFQCNVPGMTPSIYLLVVNPVVFVYVLLFMTTWFKQKPNLSLISLFICLSEQHWRTLESQRRALAFLWLCDQRMSLVHASPCVPLPHHHELWAGLWRRGLGSDPHTTTAHAWKGKKLTVCMNKWMNACCSTWGTFLSNLMNSEKW